eukprot:gene978-362_t
MPQEFDKTRSYNADKKAFGMLQKIYTMGMDVLGLVWLGPLFWVAVVDYFGAENEVTCSIAWIMALHVLQIPEYGFSFYSDFVIEEKHGFNKKDYKTFFMDIIKMEAIGIVMGLIFTPALIWIVRAGGEYFYIYVWVFVQAFIFVMMAVYPNVIMPMFNKLDTLQDEDMAVTVKFPLTGLLQIDGSKRSGHSNAFLYGFGKNKRIVLFDTILGQLTHTEICAVLAHELGHWLYGHVTVNITIASVYAFIIFYLYGQVMYSKPLFASFLYPNTDAVIIGLMLFQYIFSPVDALLNVGMTMLSRKNEFEADENAVKMGYGTELIVALKKITTENKGDLNPDKLYAWYHHTHPVLTERLEGIENNIQKRGAKEEEMQKKSEYNSLKKEFDEIRVYNAECRMFSFWRNIMMVIIHVYILVYVAPWLWFKTVEQVGAENEIICALVWSGYVKL